MNRPDGRTNAARGDSGGDGRRPSDAANAANPGSGPGPGPGPNQGSAPESDRWYDDEAGPLVRLYALTRGRARPRHEVFDLIALIIARPDRAQYRHDPALGPEHAAVLELSSRGARSVADLAADCDLPLGVTRVILSDLLEVGLIQVSRPTVPDRLPDERMLREVINGLRAL